MGNYSIHIQGVGAHHNPDHSLDANRLAEAFVRELQDSGHTIEAATFTSGSKDNLLMQPSTQQVEAEAARLYTGYCAEVGGKAFNGDPLPEWWEFVSDENKQAQARAWRKIAALALTR